MAKDLEPLEVRARHLLGKQETVTVSIFPALEDTTLDCFDYVDLAPGSAFQFATPNFPEHYGPYQQT